MKVLALNSSPLKDKGNTNIILAEFLNGLTDAGAQVEQLFISELDIKPCLGRLNCWLKTPGMCCQKDDMAQLLEKLAAAEVWVFATPLYWDGMTGPMKNFVDRLLPMIQPKIELISGHCRHALRDSVRAGKIVLVSTCGFWELDNFEPLVQQIKAICKNIHREFSGALLRPNAALIKYSVKDPKNVKLREVLSAAHQAGFELGRTGRIAETTLTQVSRELMSIEEYIKMINDNFDKH